MGVEQGRRLPTVSVAPQAEQGIPTIRSTFDEARGSAPCNLIYGAGFGEVHFHLPRP
jgi:hypothetical protein